MQFVVSVGGGLGGVGWGGCDNVPINYNTHVHYKTTVNIYTWVHILDSRRVTILHFQKFNIYIYDILHGVGVGWG